MLDGAADFHHLLAGGTETLHPPVGVERESVLLDEAAGAFRDGAAIDPAEGRTFLASEKNVLGDGEVGGEQRLLMDHRDADGGGFGGAAEEDFRALPEHAAGIARDDAGRDFYQRGFTGAVFSQQQVDFAAVDGEITVAQGGDAAESLADVFEAEQFQTCMLAQTVSILPDIYSGMAALVDAAPRTPELVDLRRLSGHELDPLLLEETVEWRNTLDWDFSKSAELVRRYAETRSLGGVAALDRGEVAGYGYTVIEDHKGLIGDVYVRPAWRGEQMEVRIFRAMLEELIAVPQVTRVESQLMLVNAETARQLQRERFIRLFERILMTLEPDAAMAAGEAAANPRFRFEAWTDGYHDAAAGMLSTAYAGHIDSQINDQYRTLIGARRFLYNIIQFPGCGVFFRPASLIALDAITGMVLGISLASFVSDSSGHITQLCVGPSARGQGLGRELLRRSVAALRANGARRVSLTVTAANIDAVGLYQRFGFREVRRFFAYVWEGA